MDPFNLVEKPWIPVRWRTEADEPQPDLVSLADALKRGTEIADLDCAPHERISLTRLLVCIVHASSGAPEDFEGWDGFGETVAEKAVAYLNRPEIHPHFNLLGDGPRFLQMKKPEVKTVKDGQKDQPLSKIFFELSSGNNPTLFDHWGESDRPWSHANVAIGLLCLQNFFVGGSMGPAVKGNGPSLKSLQTFLLGDTLQFTILRNCIDLRTLQQTGGGLGVPVWESAPDNNFLARLAPVHCSLWLSDDLSTTLLAPGYEYPQYEAYRDPYATTLTRKNKRQLLRAEQGKAIWRDLHLLINIQHAEGISGPLNLQAFNSRCNYIENTELWVGELIKDRDAKILDAIESTFTVTHQLFSDLGHNIYQAGVDFAERVAVQLVKSVKAYWLNLTELNQKNTTNCRKPNPLIAKAEKHYWHRLDQEHRTLIQLAGDPRARVGQPGFGETGADDHWTELVRKAALEAYRAVCPQTTPRQIQAHANGIKILLRVLYPKVKKQKTATA